jgi:hypothetical protein
MTMDLKGITDQLQVLMSDGRGEWEATALGGPDTTPGPDDFVAESDAFAYDKLAVEQASAAGPSDSFIPVEQIRPTESLLPTDSSDSTGTAFDEVVMVDCPILSNPNESGDWILI